MLAAWDCESWQSREHTLQRQFNHDLLVEEVDQELVRSRWPQLAGRLVNQKLIDRFLVYDAQAKRYKRMTHRFGVMGVICLGLALGLEVVDVWGNARAVVLDGWLRDLSGRPAELVGLVGLILAFLGSRWGPFRRRWLFARFACESLRQWHFRSVLLGTASPEADAPEAGEQVAAMRDQALAIFLRKLETEGRDRMDELRERRIPPYTLDWPVGFNRKFSAMSDLLGAYRELRLDHQLNYMVHKTGIDARTCVYFSPRDLLRVVDVLAAGTLVGGLVLSFVQIFFVNATTGLGVTAPYWSILLVMLGVCIRAWRDGSAFNQEHELFEEMRHRLEMLQARWLAADNDRERWLLAIELEDASLDELRSFLRTHERAQFVV